MRMQLYLMNLLPARRTQDGWVWARARTTLMVGRRNQQPFVHAILFGGRSSL